MAINRYITATEMQEALEYDRKQRDFYNSLYLQDQVGQAKLSVPSEKFIWPCRDCHRPIAEAPSCREQHCPSHPPAQTERSAPMTNYTLSVFLLPDSKARMVQCVYDPQKDDWRHHDRYAFKTFDESIAVGDYCVVPTKGSGARLEMTTVKVVEVDVEPDFEVSHEFKWIVAKIDTSMYERTLATEQELIDRHRNLEKRKRRAELARTFNEESQEQGIGLVTFNGDEAPAPSTTDPDDEIPF